MDARVDSAGTGARGNVARKMEAASRDDDDDDAYYADVNAAARRGVKMTDSESEDDDEDDEEDADVDDERLKFDETQKSEVKVDERDTKVRILLIRERDAEFARDKTFKSRSITELNNEAVEYLKRGDDVRCVISYAKLFRKVAENNVTHPSLYVCHSNRAFAYLNLGLFEEALWDGHRAQTLANARFAQTQNDDGTVKQFIKGYARKGFAFLGLQQPRLAKIEFESGLAMCPNDEELKRGLEEAIQAVIRDLYVGRGREKQYALPSSTTNTSQRISSLPYSAPLHRVHPRDMLPNKLLTPFQAEND